MEEDRSPAGKIVAVFPGGPSTPIVLADQDPELSFEGLEQAGSRLGTGGVVVIDDSVEIRKLASDIAGFFARRKLPRLPSLYHRH